MAVGQTSAEKSPLRVALLHRDDVARPVPRSTMTSSSSTATSSRIEPSAKLSCGIHIGIGSMPWAMSLKTQLS